MAKIAVTPTIVLAEFIFFGKKVSFHKVTFTIFGITYANVLKLLYVMNSSYTCLLDSYSRIILNVIFITDAQHP